MIEEEEVQFFYYFHGEYSLYCVGAIEEKMPNDTVKLVRLTWHEELPSSEKLIKFHEDIHNKFKASETVGHETLSTFLEQNKESYIDSTNLNKILSNEDLNEYGIPEYIFTKLALISPLKHDNNFRLSLTPVLKKQLTNTDSSDDAVIITHFHQENNLPRASEYIEGYDSDTNEENIAVKLHPQIVITSHGIGSGIYGIHNQELVEQQKQTKNLIFTTFTIKEPFAIKDPSHATMYSDLSLNLMRVAKEIALLTIKTRKEHANTSLKELRQQVVSQYMKDSKNKTIINKLTTSIKRLFEEGGYAIDDPETQLQKCLENFNIKAKKSNYTPMPINYLMTEQGFDGMLATDLSNWDNFSRGCILFVNDVTKYHSPITAQFRSKRVSSSQQNSTEPKVLLQEGSPLKRQRIPVNTPESSPIREITNTVRQRLNLDSPSKKQKIQF